MTVPITLYYWFMSTVPILLLMTLMGGLLWGAAKAAPVTLVVTIILSLFVFKGSVKGIGIELLKASWSSLSIILVIFAALLLYEVIKAADAFHTLAHFIEGVAPNELLRIQLVGVVFASFLQGVSGFGVPILITAPLLMRMGMVPFWAVVIPLVGHSWAGTNGTMALAWTAMVQQLQVEDSAFPFQAALYAAFFLLLLLAAANVYIAYSYGGRAGVVRGMPSIMIITLVQGGGQLVLAGNYPELAVFLPSMVTLVSLTLLCKSPLYSKPWSDPNSKIMKKESIHRMEPPERTAGKSTIFQSLFPYGVIILLALPVLLINPLNDWLSQVAIGPAFHESGTGLGFINPAITQYAPFTPFKHASFFLLLAALLTFLFYKKKGLFADSYVGTRLLRGVVMKSIPPSISILSLMGIAKVMAGTGQTIILAEGMAEVLKDSYVWVSPLLGMIGSFLTGGNMSSNILFGNVQLYSAQMIGADSASIIGAQTAGGSLGMMLASNIITLGTGITGLLGKEGRVILKLLPFALAVALLMGGALYLVNRLVGFQ